MADSSHPTAPGAAQENHRKDSDSPVSSLNSPRTTRFAEATSVQSPVESQSPFADPITQPQQQQQQQKTTPPDVSDFGFGYVSNSDPAQYASHHQAPATPASPLKSALKVPGTPGRTLNPMSPTFKEEFYVEKHEQIADKENARDVKIKLRVRLAKIFLRFVNFGCSLIVLAILGTTLSIFNATKNLPPRNNLPAWAEGTNPWAQWLMLGVACVSLVCCLMVFYGYFRGGHQLAQKYALYYSILSVCFFGFNLIMWVVATGIYQSSKSNGNNKDMWGWSCSQNVREKLFHSDINYALMCRLQDWGLVCAVIEIVLEVLVILIYVVVLYRFVTKHRLAKVMDQRGKARSELHLAQMRIQSPPTSPAAAAAAAGPPGTANPYASPTYPHPYGFPQTPKSPFVSSPAPLASVNVVDPYSAAENGQAYNTTQMHTQTQGQNPGSGSTIQYATPRSPTKPQPTFQLQQPPPARAHQSPRSNQGQWSPTQPSPTDSTAPAQAQALAQPQTQTQTHSLGVTSVPAAQPSPALGLPMSPPPGGQQFASLGPAVNQDPASRTQ